MKRLLMLVGAVALAVPAMGEEACREDVLDLRGDWGTARFRVEIADTPDEQRRGLMFREHLAPSRGMLFVYPQAGAPAFWMKNTLIPLDMLFIRPDGTVQHVHENAIPGDLSPHSGGAGVLAVLEIAGGMAARLGIAEGDVLRHPAFGAQAVWACPAQ